MLAKMMSCFKAFDRYNSTEMADWIGVGNMNLFGPSFYDKMPWRVLDDNIIILFFLFVGRASSRWTKNDDAIFVCIYY
jgi:hypothetical protein